MTKRERQVEVAQRFHHIGDVAALTGLSADALRAWERVGLLTPQRSPGGMRQYSEDDIARIRLIARTLQRGGFSRSAVAMLLRSGDLQPDAADYAPGLSRIRPSRARTNASSAMNGGDRSDDREVLAAIARIGDALASGRALEEILAVVCVETCWAFGVSDAILWLAEPRPMHHASLRTHAAWAGEGRADGVPERTSPPRALVAAAASGQHRGAGSSAGAAPRSLPLDDQRFPPVRAYLSGRSLVVTTADLSEVAHPELVGMLPAAALLSMPLLTAQSEPVGVLMLREAHDADRFRADDLERIRLFAVHATLAIETARLHTAIDAARADADTQRIRWQAVVDNLPALVCICDAALEITYANPSCQKVLGWPAFPGAAADPEGQPASWVARQGFYWLADAVPTADGAPDGVPPDELPLPRALRERRAIHNITIVHRRADRTDRVITWSAAVMPDASGQLLGAVAFGRDVTAEHRLREREASLTAVTLAATVAATTETIERRSKRILTALVENKRSPMMAATLYLLDDQTGTLLRVCTVGGEHSGAHAPVMPITPQHPWWQVLIAGPVYSAHDREQPRWLRGIGLVTWKASSMRAWATVPLRVGGKLVGALAVGLSAPHAWDAAERTWLEACAAVITMSVENGRLPGSERGGSRT